LTDRASPHRGETFIANQITFLSLKHGETRSRFAMLVNGLRETDVL